MGELTCEGKVSGLQFKLNNTNYFITGFANCPTTRQTSCYFRRNFISIRNDSLIIKSGNEKKKKHISYLKNELENIMTKPYNFEYDEHKVKPALINFYVEDKYPVATIKTVLKEIAEQFSKINLNNHSGFFKYTIRFNDFDITSITPPPKPNKVDIEN